MIKLLKKKKHKRVSNRSTLNTIDFVAIDRHSRSMKSTRRYHHESFPIHETTGSRQIFKAIYIHISKNENKR